MQCNASVNYSAATAGTTELVSAQANKRVYVCNYIMDSAGGTQTVSLVYGTGTACATGTANLTPGWSLGANQGLVDNVTDAVLQTAVGNALCINVVGSGQIAARVSYLQQ